MKQTFRQNGNLDCFVDKSMEINRNKLTSPNSVEESRTPIRTFREDTVADMLSRRTKVVIRNTYFAAELRILFTSQPVPLFQTKDKRPMDSTFYCVPIHLYSWRKLCSRNHRKTVWTDKGTPSEMSEQKIKNRHGIRHTPNRIGSSNQPKWSFLSLLRR